jgi:hypothetical protein
VKHIFHLGTVPILTKLFNYEEVEKRLISTCNQLLHENKLCSVLGFPIWRCSPYYAGQPNFWL